MIEESWTTKLDLVAAGAVLCVTAAVTPPGLPRESGAGVCLVHRPFFALKNLAA